MIDIAYQVKSRIGILDVIERYCAVPERRNGYKRVRIPCPLHNGKDNNFAVDTETGTYNCFVCGKHGDAISFVRDYFDLPFIAACEKINNDFGLGIPIGQPLTDEQIFDAVKIENALLEKRKKAKRRRELYMAAFDKLLDCDMIIGRFNNGTKDQEKINEYCHAVEESNYWRCVMEELA